MKILFICTGNTCRSPMAAVLAEQIFHRHTEISSAGTDAWEGSEASAEAVAVLRERELDLTGHRSRRVTREMIAGVDWVIPMTKAHELRLKALFPEYERKIVCLGEWSENARDVHDPWGGSLAEYRRCAAEIEELLFDLHRRLNSLGDGEKE